MDAALNWLWQGCVVALAWFVMLRLLERARANVRYVVCWIALLLIVALPVLSRFGSTSSPPGPVSLTPANAIVSVPDVWWTSSALMLAAWSVWGSVHMVRFLAAMVVLRRARARSRPFPPQTESLLQHWRQVRDEGRRPTLVVSEAVPTAAVLGCGAPMIAVAPRLLTTLSSHELDRVLIHEWSHVQRRDDVVNMLQLVIRIVAGWHPAVWWIERRLHVEREVACDEMTVAMTGSPKSYAACLVKLAGLRGAEATGLAAPAMLTASGLRSRVTRIVSRHAFIAPLCSRGIATGVVVALSMLALGVGGQRLVEMAALPPPLESSPMVHAMVYGIAPILVPTHAPQVRRSPRQSGRPAPLAQGGRSVEEPAPIVSSPSASDARITAEAPRVVDPTVAPATRNDADASVAADSPTTPAVPDSQPPAATVEGDRSLWAEAADQGTAIGRHSKEAGVATGRFFTRFARRVAGSF